MPSELKRRLRAPILTMLALLALLGTNVVLGIFFINDRAWIAEVFIAMAMVAIVILFAMEALKDPPIIRLFAGLGFFWVAILFALTMVDYATR
jgi:cytochrome c oxidase subunit IV